MPFALCTLSSKRVSLLRAIPLDIDLILLLNPSRRAADAHHHTAHDFAFPNLQSNNGIRTLAYRLFHKPVDGLIARLVYDARHTLCFSPAAVETACDVLDERLRVFARRACSSVDGTEDANDAMAGQIERC